MKWTDEENNLIISSIANNKTYLEMTVLLPNRTTGAIKSQGAKLRKGISIYNKWSTEEIVLLIELRIQGLTYKDCSQFLDKDIDSIKQKGAQLLKYARTYELEEYNSAWEFLKLYYNEEL